MQICINQELFEYIGELENQVVLLSKEVEKMKESLEPCMEVDVDFEEIADIFFRKEFNEPGIKPV